MSKAIDKLVSVVTQLRAPDGCPWDREQTHTSMLPDLLDEVYEFFESADEGDDYGMKEELGDILLQVVFHAQIASEEQKYALDDVATAITAKLIRRHPHVFGDVKVNSTEEVLTNWEAIKSKEKGKEDRKYIADGIPEALPALFRAQKVQKCAAKTGFDWTEIAPVLDKVEEEFQEFREALASNDQEHAEEELGDILFSLVNVARHKGINAEEALRKTTKKFVKRFTYVEQQYDCDHEMMKSATLEELDSHWDDSKKAEH